MFSITRRLFGKVLSLFAISAAANVLSIEDSFGERCNRLIYDAFLSHGGQWHRAETAVASDFRCTGGVVTQRTTATMAYGKQFVCEAQDIDETCRRIGREGAEHLWDIVNRIAPTGLVRIVFIGNHIAPRIDAVELDGDRVTIRVYHDFGVEKIA